MNHPRRIFLYGPPASGKSFLGRHLAMGTGGSFIDLDGEIVRRINRPIASFFAEKGEASFRELESAVLREVVEGEASGLCIVALGGGTLLSGGNRGLCEGAGTILCLEAPEEEELERRIQGQAGLRPLGNKAKERSTHYASFPSRIARAFLLQDSLVVVGNGIAPELMPREHVVFDEAVAELYPVLAGRKLAVIPSGEQYKTPETVLRLWHAFAEAGLGRKDSVAACGGGVTGDLTGFAAATWMRGISWTNVPTTLLSMVDASTGGKTGCDLPEGKNLAGAFHSPKLVLIDTDFLKSLPERELRSGRGEMLKHHLLGSKKPQELQVGIPSAKEIAESLAVKVDVVLQDPRETLGRRMLLNCGHTIGHAVEAASGYRLSHGEAVAIGCVEEARLAARLHLADADWPEEVAACFREAGLPIALPAGQELAGLKALMRQDKKKQGDSVTFALPCAWGDVRLTKISLDTL